MNKYESVIVINPKLDEQEIDNIIQKVKEIVEQDGRLTQVDKKGIKKLAYEIKKQSEGYYVVYTFEANPEFIKELERIYRITDSIMKFITIRKED